MSSREIDRNELPHFEILRLGHRPERDKRITTHVALLSRAFGARGIHVDTHDSRMEKTIERVNEQFGGDFFIRTGVGRKGIMRKWNGTMVHLTMYGAPLDSVMDRIPRDERILVIVGAEKVPRDVYDNSHFNVSVASQPHSEVSALALFIDRLCEGREMDVLFGGGEARIIPDDTGKSVLGTEDGGSVRYHDPLKTEWPPVPSVEDCMEILRSLGTSDMVMEHVKAVHKLGVEIVKRSGEEHPEKELDIDMDLLEAGLLLHDIGRSVTHSIGHIDKGHDIARELGMDDRICAMIRNHIGAGVSASEAQELGLVEEDHIPDSLMEMVVCHADNLVGEKERRPLSEAVGRLESKGASKAAERMKELHLHLEKTLGIDLDELVRP